MVVMRAVRGLNQQQAVKERQVENQIYGPGVMYYRLSFAQEQQEKVSNAGRNGA